MARPTKEQIESGLRAVFDQYTVDVSVFPDRAEVPNQVRRERAARAWQSFQWFLLCASLRAELHTERMRLAGCGVAARGYQTSPCHPDYECDSLQAVRDTYSKLEAARAELAKVSDMLIECERERREAP